jgi:hypothetical protein
VLKLAVGDCWPTFLPVLGSVAELMGKDNWTISPPQLAHGSLLFLAQSTRAPSSSSRTAVSSSCVLLLVSIFFVFGKIHQVFLSLSPLLWLNERFLGLVRSGASTRSRSFFERSKVITILVPHSVWHHGHSQVGFRQAIYSQFSRTALQNGPKLNCAVLSTTTNFLIDKKLILSEMVLYLVLPLAFLIIV